MKKTLLLTLLSAALLATPAYAATGTGTGVLGDTKSVNTTLKNGTYYLEDQTKFMFTQKGSTISTYNFNNRTTTQYYMTDVDNIWNTSAQRAAVDAHVYTGKVYDYWYTKWGRNSYDNNGAPMIAGVHYSTGYNNMFWNGSQLILGDGDGTNFISFAGALDLVAHEWFHPVIDHEAGLDYTNQSGALYESWSDAFGVTMDSDDWCLGEDVYTPGKAGDAIHCMSDPTRWGLVAHMDNYLNTTVDNGGVHTNKGIPNKAFYNFVTAIGSRDVAMRIWYVALRDYMTSTSTFQDARDATLQATSVLHGTPSSYYMALANAWAAVGIY